MDPRRQELSPQLRAFLYTCIDSIEQLDVLMLLQSSEAPRSARGVAQELGLADARARAYLDALAARGLAKVAVRGDVLYEFGPASEALRGYAEELALELHRGREAVIRFVAALPPPAIRSFANAFRLRESD